ncbi:site-2 protease family protein [Microvirga flavescens]|uniref:site-2 protease family protein n=1 Tax=Microvirga flavescens TaxID=2249811 RepID=UPI000DDB8E77|nr:site-2 protease family protein [Microvirga flavescens]
MPDPDILIAVMLVLALLGYVLFVNRRRQHYSGQFVLDVPIEEAWELLSMTPGRPKQWIPTLLSTEWSNEYEKEAVSRFESGHECYSRLIASEAPMREECVAVYRWRGASKPGDLLYTRLFLQPVPEGTQVQLSYTVERADIATGFIPRLNYPMLVGSVARLVRGYLARERGNTKPGANASKTGDQKRDLLKQVILAALSLAAMTYLLGFSIGLAVLGTIIVHEYGHVWALRRHGHQARFYLIPFFGGIAIGNRSYVSDAEASEVILMGPAFGLLPPLACLGVFAATDDALWLSAGFVSLFVNMFNLLPVPPLDGGRLVQTLLKPLGDKAWFGVSGLLILGGAALALYMRSQSFLVIVIMAAVAWSAAPKRPPAMKVMTLSGNAAALASYIALIALHAGAVWWCDQVLDGRLLRQFGLT